MEKKKGSDALAKSIIFSISLASVEKCISDEVTLCINLN